MTSPNWAMMAAVACLAATSSTARAAVDVNSVPRTTGDLVALCSTQEADPMHAAAASFCHGFALGAVTVEIERDRASRAPALFCLPETPPTVQQGIASFVAWANASPARLAEPAADGLMRYLDETYPCPEAARPGRRARRTRAAP